MRASGPHCTEDNQIYGMEASMENVVAGIDVGKWRLDVSVSQGPVRSFDNTPEGIAALLGWVTGEGASCVSRLAGMSGKWCAGCGRAGCR